MLGTIQRHTDYIPLRLSTPVFTVRGLDYAIILVGWIDYSLYTFPFGLGSALSRIIKSREFTEFTIFSMVVAHQSCHLTVRCSTN